MASGYATAASARTTPVTREQMAAIMASCQGLDLTLPDASSAAASSATVPASRPGRRRGLELMRRTGIVEGDARADSTRRKTRTAPRRRRS